MDHMARLLGTRERKQQVTALELGEVLKLSVRDNGQDACCGGGPPSAGVTWPACPSGALTVDADLRTATREGHVRSTVCRGKVYHGP